MDYKSLMGYGKKKNPTKKQSKPKKNKIVEGIKQDLVEWDDKAFKNMPRRWSKSLDSGLTEYEKLNEQRELDSKIIKKIEKMTDRNNHMAARTHLSYYLEGGNRGKFFKYWDAVSQINDILGGTPSELRRLNQKIEKDFYRAIKNKFSNAKEIIGAL